MTLDEFHLSSFFASSYPLQPANSSNSYQSPQSFKTSRSSHQIIHSIEFQLVELDCIIDLVDCPRRPPPNLTLSSIDMANHSQKLSKKTPISTCEQSRSAWIDLVILIAVIGACGFLIYPYVKLLCSETLEILEAIMSVIKYEVVSAPMIYGCLGLSIFSASMAVLAITLCTSQKCGKPGCRGLHKAAEFDIQLETDDCMSNSSSSNGASNLGKVGLKKGLFELPRDYHKELEAELKKMAPINGRAVLVFRARCGCSVGRMEVLGPKKNNRKIKK